MSAIGREVQKKIFEFRARFMNHLEGIVFKETDSGAKRIATARWAPIVEFIIMTSFKAILIVVFYFVFSLLAGLWKIPIKDEIVGSLATFPFLTLIKTIPETFHSYFVEIFIADAYIVKKEGYINTTQDKLYLENIDNIELHTTFFGKWFGYSHINLLSFGGSVNLPYVGNSMENKIQLEKIIAKVKKEE